MAGAGATQEEDEITFGYTRRLCEFLAHSRLEDIPPEIVERGKHVILDGVGCGLLAAKLEWSIRAVDAMVGLEGGNTATVWGWNSKTTPSVAALVNGTAIQGFELDDHHSYGPLHSAACVIPPVVAAAEQRGDVSGRSLLEGILYGFEVGPRIGMMFGGTAMLNKGWHCGAISGVVASAAGVGKLLQLNVDQFESAISIAATQAAGLMSAQHGGMIKRMHSGLAARNGLVAGILAKADYSGIAKVIERKYGGFATTYAAGGEFYLDKLIHELGKRWEIGRIAFKPPYSCMGGCHSSVQGALSIRNEPGFDVGQIAAIDITMAHSQFLHAGWQIERPANSMSAQMSVRYSVCVALIDGDAFVPQFTPDRVNQEDVWALLAKVNVHDEPTLKALDGLGYAARVKISLNSGKVLEREIRHPKGGSLDPLTNEEVRSKFHLMAELVMDSSRARAIESTVMNLEKLPDVSSLIALLGPVVASPF